MTDAYREGGRRRLGRIEIPFDDLYDNLEEVAEIFRQLRLVPLHMVSDFAAQTAEYQVLSPYFDMVDAGKRAHDYRIVVARDDDDTVTVTAERVTQ